MKIVIIYDETTGEITTYEQVEDYGDAVFVEPKRESEEDKEPIVH